MYKLRGLKKFSNLIHACSEKSDGNMSFRWGEKEEVLGNRRKFLGSLGIRPRDSVAMFLQHGTEIALVDPPHSKIMWGMDESSCGEEALTADCLITKSKNVFLFVLTGDCLPIVFYDPFRKLVGLAHVSRINTSLLFVRKIVRRFEEEGSRPENITVVIGPGVRKKSYAFDRDELAKRVAGHDGWKDFLISLPDGKIGIDLVGYNMHQLVSAGVLPENIEVAEVDTIADKNFFSHYRSRKTGEKEGRMATIVGFTK